MMVVDEKATKAARDRHARGEKALRRLFRWSPTLASLMKDAPGWKKSRPRNRRRVQNRRQRHVARAIMRSAGKQTGEYVGESRPSSPPPMKRSHRRELERVSTADLERRYNSR